MWSDLFLLPFLTGLCLALILPVLGCFLRLRDEWLAALAYALLPNDLSALRERAQGLIDSVSRKEPAPEAAAGSAPKRSNSASLTDLAVGAQSRKVTLPPSTTAP